MFNEWKCLCFQILFDRTVVPLSCFLISDVSLHSRKIVDKIRDVLWSKLLLKQLTVPDHDRFLYTPVKFQERLNFPTVFGSVDRKHIRFKCPTKLISSSSSSSSLVFSPKAGFGRNQSPVRRPVWLWHTAF